MVNFSGFFDGQRRPSGGAKSTNFFLVINLLHKNNNSTFFFRAFFGPPGPPGKNRAGARDLARPKAARKSRLFPDNCRIFFPDRQLFEKSCGFRSSRPSRRPGPGAPKIRFFSGEFRFFFRHSITFSKKFRKSRGSRPVGTAAAGPRIKIRRITV